MESFVFLLLASFFVAAMSNVCPFPGIPKNGNGTRTKESKIIDWNSTSGFDIGEVVEYNCSDGWATPWGKGAIQCQEGGTWNDTVPKCEEKSRDADWDKTLITLYANKKPKESKMESCSSGTQYQYIRLKPLREFRVSRLKEIHVELCQNRTAVFTATIRANRYSDNSSCRLIHNNPNMQILRCDFSDPNITNEMIDFIEVDSPPHQFSIQQLSLLLHSGDYCGIPAFPINGKIRNISANESQFDCNDGFILNGTKRSTCDPETGLWNPLPKCVVNSTSPGNGMNVIIYSAGSAGALFITVLLALLIKRFICSKSDSTNKASPEVKSDQDETIYENIIQIPVNEQPIYADLEFASRPLAKVPPAIEIHERVPEVIYSTVSSGLPPVDRSNKCIRK